GMEPFMAKNVKQLSGGQKQPIVLMVEWKYYIHTDYDTAKQKYEEAKMMARMFGNEKLIVSLDNEWSEDLERYC
ncbi:MAG: XRE family transcriptional regulator, partial [Streptococcus mitis]|nr:XRE family transcriptional regulator [Streptococcus mitis]